MAVRFQVITTDATLAGALVERSFDQPPVVIGRAADADLVLDDPSVALHQARLARGEVGWTIEDLDSGRTRLSGRSLPPGRAVPLRPGQVLELGVYALLFDEPPEPARVPDARSAAKDLARRLLALRAADHGPDPGRPLVRVVNGPLAGRRLALAEGACVRLGRGRDCDLVLDDGRVSRLHARLRLRAGRVWVEDARSANGVRLDGRRLAGPACWPAGSRLGIGRFELELVYLPCEPTGWGAALAPPPAGERRGGWLAAACFGLALAAGLAAVWLG